MPLLALHVLAHLDVGLFEDEHAGGEGHKKGEAVLDAQEVCGPHLAAALVRAHTHVDDLVAPHYVTAAAAATQQQGRAAQGCRSWAKPYTPGRQQHTTTSGTGPQTKGRAAGHTLAAAAVPAAYCPHLLQSQRCRLTPLVLHTPTAAATAAAAVHSRSHHVGKHKHSDEGRRHAVGHADQQDEQHQPRLPPVSYGGGVYDAGAVRRRGSMPAPRQQQTMMSVCSGGPCS